MKNRKIRSLADTLTVLLVSASFVIFSPCTGLAEDIDFEVTVDRNKVYLGSNIRLDLNFYGTQNMPTPTLPEIDGFEWRYLGPSSRISIVNGASSSSITHMYALEPQRTGVFDIPAIVINYRGETYFSKPIQVEVVKSQFSRPSSGSRGRSAEGRSSGLDDRIFIVMEAGKKSAYINEVIPVTIRLYVRKLSIRDIQYPQFPHEGFLAGEGVFRDLPFYVDLLMAHVYAGYINDRGGQYLRTDFTIEGDPMMHTRRMLGLDAVDTETGRTRLGLIDGQAHYLGGAPALPEPEVAHADS